MSFLGKLIYHSYHQPVGWVRHSLRNGGPWVESQTRRNQEAMVAAASTLAPLPVFADAGSITLHLLTGKRFWYQAAFCLRSFAHHARVNLNVEIYDDGSIDKELSETICNFGNSVRLQPISETRHRLETFLPASKFPALRERWQNYPNIRKLIDVHLGREGNKLVIDSDLLFFGKPQLMLDWSAKPVGSLTAIDCEESYGYTRPLMERLAGATIPSLVNVGLCGLNSSSLDWNELEHWCAELIKAERTSYYLEQGLVAMLVARETGRTIAPKDDYITRPTEAEVRRGAGVMQHYVDTSKRWYFRDGWRLVAAELG